MSIFSLLHISKGLAIYCGEEGGEGSVSTLLQVLSDFATSLENGVKKYDERLEREKRAKKKQQDKKTLFKNKDKENEPNAKKSTRPHVGLKKPLGHDAKNELMDAIKNRGTETTGTESKTRPSSAQENPRQAPLRRDAKNELMDAIKNRGTETTGTESKTRPSSAQENPRQAPLRRDARNELMDAIKDRGTENTGAGTELPTLSAQENPRQAPLRRDARSELMDAIKGRGTETSGTESIMRPSSAQENPRKALLDSIKRRRESLPVKPQPDGVNERIKHINNNLQRQESRVLLTHRMLNEAPESVRKDFVKGVVYTETKDPLLRKIYESEGETRQDGETKSEVVDPRLELLAAIRKHRK